MKKILILCLAVAVLLCSCSLGGNTGTDSLSSDDDKSIIGKWIDVETEQIVEYTEGGFYYEYINESFTTDKTRYVTENGFVYYFLDGDTPDYDIGIPYEIKDGNLIIAGGIIYKPMDLKTTTEEMQ